MITFISPRLRVPARDAFLGAVFAAAWIVRGGPTWWFAILTAICVAVRVGTVYVRGGQDSDAGALLGSRPDERVRQATLKSRALAANFALVASFVGLTAGIAAKADWWWPFLVIGAVTGFGYLLGLSNNGFGEES